MLKALVILLFVAYASAQKSATVYLFDPTGSSGVTGNVIFTKSDSGVIVTGTVKGLAAGNHGFHVHNLGNIAEGCTATGPHFNPHNLTHGAPEDKIRHVGDLGNIVASSNGQATINITDSVIDLDGVNGIIGRAVVVHAGVDDLGKGGNAESLATGNAGARVACGVIGILNSSAAITSSPFIIIATLVSLKIFWNREVDCTP